MTVSYFQPALQRIVLLVFLAISPLVANSATEVAISEKRIMVAIRTIGHEVMKCLGDQESRILPIEKISEHDHQRSSYRVAFAAEFGFDPYDIVSTIEHVMTEANIATNYLVEVEQCETKEVVHSFEIRNWRYADLIPCEGRLLPQDCYALIITILEQTPPPSNLRATAAGSSVVPPDSASVTSHSFAATFLFVLLLSLAGFAAYYFKRKKAHRSDPNLLIIGASQFDQKNRALSFADKSVELSNKEAELLSLLHTSVNTPLEREVILQKVWGDEGDYVGRTLDVFISKLRKKLEADASVKIVNIRGVGYKLVTNAAK